MPLPRYEQIAAHLRGQITRGELTAGDALPSGRELAETWQVTRVTADRALRTLRDEGLVEVRVGQGTYVKAQAPLHITARERYRHSREEGAIYRSGEHARILAAELVPAPDHVADRLGMEPGAQVIRRHRLTFEGEHPAAMSTSWHRGELADSCPRLLSAERNREGMRYVEVCTGRRAESCQQWVTARLATDEEAELLDLKLPAALAESHSLITDASGWVLEYGISLARAGRLIHLETTAL